MAAEETPKPEVPLDDEARALLLEAEKAKAREAIAKARQATTEAETGPLTDLVPSGLDAAKGEVTLGEGSGAFGPWRAHRLIAGVAEEIAGQVRSTFTGDEASRVLVVDDRRLLADHWTATRVLSVLTTTSSRLTELHHQLEKAEASLDEAIDAIEGQGTTLPDDDDRRRRRGIVPDAGGTGGADTGGTTATEGTGGTTGGVGVGAMRAAIDLLGLLRTDFTLTATAVTVAPSELATLTAAHLAAPAASAQQGVAVTEGARAMTTTVTVEADSFATVRSSPSGEALARVITARERAAQALVSLSARLAPLESELTTMRARVAGLEEAWTTAIADGKDEPTLLRETADRLRRECLPRERAAAAARVHVAYAQQTVTQADEVVAALAETPEGREAPLLTAVRRERITGTMVEDRVSHVLYVSLDAAAADAITRRSLLGTSGRMRFVSTAAASWLLLDAATGTVRAGGQKSLADVLTFDLERGTASFSDTWLTPGAPGTRDPLVSLENWAKGLVAVSALVLVLVGVASVLAFLGLVQAAVR